MKGRQLAVAIFILACLAALTFSYFSWKQKLAGASGDEAILTGLEGPLARIDATEEVQGMGPASDKGLISNGNSAHLIASELTALSANMDEELANLLASRFKAGKNIKLLIVGSQAIEQGGNGGAAGIIADSLKDAYKGYIETDIVSFTGTSHEFINSLDELIDWDGSAYDALLLEPFTLNNNGRVIIEDEHRHILSIRERLQEVTEDAVLILMPSQPIYRPNFYATQIRSLDRFAAARGIPFVNHWMAWPDVTDAEILNYFDTNSAPNEMGANAWGKALQEYFINSSE